MEDEGFAMGIVLVAASIRGDGDDDIRGHHGPRGLKRERHRC